MHQASSLVMTTQMLLVEPDTSLRASLVDVVRTLARVDECGEFQIARVQVLANAYDWLVTNLRLRAYNGLHLVHLITNAGLSTRSLVYGDRDDASLAREAQLAGAFFEPREGLHRALPAYLRGDLPARDRRDPFPRDRRSIFRGGRRSTDSLTHRSAN